MLKYKDKHVRMTGVKNSEHHEKSEKSEVSESTANAEKIDVKGATEVMQATADIAAEVADVGIEDAEASEGYKEGGRQKAKDPSPSAKGKKQTQQDLKAHIAKTVSTKKMRKEVEKEIRKEIRKSERKVLLAYAGIKRYSPHKLAEMIAKIRSLRDLLSSLIEATKEVLTGLYLKWVRKES